MTGPQERNHAQDSDSSAGSDVTQTLEASASVRLPSRFRLQRKLGSGAFGDALLVWDSLLERDVCIKLLRPEAGSKLEDGALHERFLREAQAAAKLKHPNIVTVYDVLESDGALAIVMEYIEGMSLKDRLARTGPLSVADATAIARQVAEGLDYAHERGIVHRDIKPANILLGNDGSVKIGDFGTAYVYGKARLTSSGGTLGTPAYMAPEQIQAGEVDRRSDVFSLGCLLHEMITGTYAFPGDNIASVVHKIVYEEPAPLARPEVDIPEQLVTVVERALAKDPADRFQRAAELAQALASGTAQPLRAMRRRRLAKPALLIGGAALAIGIVALAVVALRPRSSRVSLAVLPFENRTGRAESDFLARGFASELTKLLAEQKTVMLIPAADVTEATTRGAALVEACRKAGVSHVVTGAVETGPTGLVVEHTLTDVRRARSVTERVPVTSERLQKSVFEIRARCVAWLGLGPARTLPTVDPQAYELYLKGNGKLEEMQNGESEAFVEGKALLERALAIEPSAEIYSGLASLHYEAINQGVDPNPENLSLAGFYIDKALALRRDDLAALDTKVMLEFQLGRAEESLALIARQVLDDRLSPVLVNRIGLVLRQNGDFGAAEPFLVYAMKLAPSSFPRQLNYGRHLFESGRHGEAIALMRKLVDEYPEKFWSRMLLASYSLRLGDLPTAERFAAELPATLSARLLRYQIDRAKGDTSPFQPSDRLRRQAAIDFDTSLQLAENYALSGDQVKALEFLRTTLANGWTAWNYFDWDPCLAGLRATPEYRALHAQGLEDQKARRERERTVIAPVVKKLGISILEP